MNTKYNVGILGASGAVGKEILICLEKNNFPIKELRLLASKRSAGKKINFCGSEVLVEECTEDSFKGLDYVIFSAGSETSKKFASIAVKSGAVVIDNSSAFRTDDSVPLVIPEINSKDLLNHNGIIANPNCTTIIMLMGLAPLHDKWQVKNIIASSYQSVSGSGAQGIIEFKKQQADVVNGNQIQPPKHYPCQIINNVIPSIGDLSDRGYTSEELKMQNETRKILHSSLIRASATCVRVPVLRSHSIALSVQFDRNPDLETARKLINNAQGVKVKDNMSEGIFPTPLDTSEKYDCLVGRIRKDLVLENGLNMWIVGDQLLKGAALNAVQIMEKMTGFS